MYRKQRLTNQQVVEIRQLVAEGKGQVEIGRLYKTAQSHVSELSNGLFRMEAGGPIKQADGSFKTMPGKVPPPITVSPWGRPGRAVEFREKMRANPQRFVPGIVKGNDTRLCVTQYLRLLATVPKAADLQGLTLGEVITYLNTLMVSEKAKFKDTIAAEFFARIKPFPKAHQRLLVPIIGLAFELVLDGPARHQVFQTTKELTEAQLFRNQATNQATVARFAPLKDGLDEPGKILAQIGELTAAMIQTDPATKLDAIAKQLLEAENAATVRDGNLRTILYGLKIEIEGLKTDTNLRTTLLDLKAEIKGLATDALEDRDRLAALKVDTDALVEVMGGIKNWVDAQRNRQVAEMKAKQTPSAITPGS